MNYIKKVKDFNNLFGAPISDKPQIPSDDRTNLRIKLIQEELNELKDASNENNIVEVADACADLMVVLSGTILEFGLGEKFDDIFNNVHSSNMSKACENIEEAKQTIDKYKKDGVDSYYKEIAGKFVIYRKSDNKILKSINYTPANPNIFL